MLGRAHYLCRVEARDDNVLGAGVQPAGQRHVQPEDVVHGQDSYNNNKLVFAEHPVHGPIKISTLSNN